MSQILRQNFFFIFSPHRRLVLHPPQQNNFYNYHHYYHFFHSSVHERPNSLNNKWSSFVTPSPLRQALFTSQPSVSRTLDVFNVRFPVFCTTAVFLPEIVFLFSSPPSPLLSIYRIKLPTRAAVATTRTTTMTTTAIPLPQHPSCRSFPSLPHHFRLEEPTFKWYVRWWLLLRPVTLLSIGNLRVVRMYLQKHVLHRHSLFSISNFLLV